MAEEIADRIEKTIPPELRDKGEDGEDANNTVDTPFGPVPKEQLPAMLGQLKTQMDQMMQALQEAESGLEKERIKADSNERIALINADTKKDVEEIKGWISLMVSKMQPPPVLTARALDLGENTEQQATRPTETPPVDQAQPGALTGGENTGPEIAP